MKRTILDVHIVQTVPPSNLNRDDTGSPKTAVYGGVRRARVSSQAWKRAVRVAFMGSLAAGHVGVRTKRVVDQLADVLRERGTDDEAAMSQANELLKAAGVKLTELKKKGSGERTDQGAESGFLFFVSRPQLGALADLAGEDLTTSAVKKRAKEALQSGNSIDIALFGRMVAEPEGLNVDASCQVAHALSVHRVDNEYDYFTAVDDRKELAEAEDAGAGMIGTIEYNSATLYRYATIDVDRLRENLDGDAAATNEAVIEFVRAFATSMPTGKQTTFANRTLPDLVLLDVRSDQPVNLVGAFERPVTTRDGGYVDAAVRRLAERREALIESFGLAPSDSMVASVEGEVDGLPTPVSLPVALTALEGVLRRRVSAP